MLSRDFVHKAMIVVLTIGSTTDVNCFELKIREIRFKLSLTRFKQFGKEFD